MSRALLLDTNVVSELRKLATGRIDPHVERWAQSLDQGAAFVSALTVFELEVGVLRLAKRDPEQAAALRRWLAETVTPAFAGRVLPVDEQVARAAAALQLPDPRPLADSLIAATAMVNGFTLATRNTADFQVPGLALLNPWSP